MRIAGHLTATTDPRFVPLPWNPTREEKLSFGWFCNRWKRLKLRLYGLALLLFRYDLDGIFEATPGCRRAVQTAVSALQRNGHRVLPFRPPHLLKAMRVNTLYRAGDLGARHQAQLAIGPVCTKAFGLKHLCRIIPRLLRSSLATGKLSYFSCKQFCTQGL